MEQLIKQLVSVCNNRISSCYTTNTVLCDLFLINPSGFGWTGELGVNDLNSAGFLVGICHNGNLSVKEIRFCNIFKQTIRLKTWVREERVVSGLLSDPGGFYDRTLGHCSSEYFCVPTMALQSAWGAELRCWKMEKML